MLLNLFTLSALLGVVVSYGASNPGYFQPPRHYVRRHNWRSSSSGSHSGSHSGSDSDEKWRCSRLGIFSDNSNPNIVTSAPKIAYYTHHGKEMAIAVCNDPQIQFLFGKSPNANVPLTSAPPMVDYPLLSISSKSGMTFKCNKDTERYEAFNLFTRKTVSLDAIACATIVPADAVAGPVTTIIQALAVIGFDI